MSEEKEPAGTDPGRPVSTAVVVGLVVVALFAGVIAAKTLGGRESAPSEPSGVSTSSDAQPPVSTTVTSVHNDAVADYEEALKTDKPVYVLFHSLSCKPCVEISAAADTVVPEYEGRVVFVNAISDDASAKQLAARFQFQYIPSSFFLTADGKVADSFTGAMSEDEMRARLDALIAQ